MGIPSKRSWLVVVVFAAMCLAAIIADCASGNAAVWVSQLPSRLSGQVDGELAGMTFKLRVALCEPVSLGLSVSSSTTR